MSAPALTPLRARVARERTRLRGLVVAAGAGAGLAAAAVLLASGVAMLAGSRWMALPRGTPFVVWLLALAAVVAALLATRRVA
ncbi:MAG TPA: hypothetical protein VFX39_07045, partial [Gemmatimonadaceae bacterium]|nr:hypothetical protein [Gemmatimonadaceae bacterium]